MFLSEPQLGLTKKNEAKINWNKMEAKSNILERKQWSKLPASKCVIFFIFFGYTNESTFRWKKFCPSVLHRVPETQIQQKLHSPNSSFPKMLLTFQSRLLAFKRWLKSLNEKKTTSRTFWKGFSISIKLLHKLSFKNLKKWCLQWCMKCSWGTYPLVYLFRFASVVNFDRSQLKHSFKSAKCRKRSQRMSLSFK